MPVESEQEAVQRVQQEIFRIARLKAMPQVVWQLLGVLRDENSSPVDVRRIVESDPALASKILSLANSAYYGMSHKVATIERAVVVIGFQELILLSLGSGLSDLFETSSAPEGFDAEGLWLHSLAVSWAAREMASAAGYHAAEEIMVAGLLHDLGKLVLATQLPVEYGKVLALAEQGTPHYQAEERFFLDHDLIGYWLSLKWGLPEIHVSVIRNHHRLEDDGELTRAAALTALADHLVKTIGVGLQHQSRPMDLEKTRVAAGLTQEQHERITQDAARVVPGMVDAWLGVLGKSQ